MIVTSIMRVNNVPLMRPGRYTAAMSISENARWIRQQIEESALRAGRNPQDITLMTVSKTRSVEEIREAHEAGLGPFGENRIEEAALKFSMLNSQDYPLYLIGHLQSNKIKFLDGRFRGLHSLDSLKLARRISSHRQELDLPLDVLIQVNTSGEDSKFGFRDKSQFLEAAAEIAELPELRLLGLMTMAPFVDDEIVIRSCFAECRRWSEDIVSLCDSKTPTLSMGMTSDFEWAIAEGSTLLRIGTALFGERGR